jgi:hypothetical protein
LSVCGRPFAGKGVAAAEIFGRQNALLVLTKSISLESKPVNLQYNDQFGEKVTRILPLLLATKPTLKSTYPE